MLRGQQPSLFSQQVLRLGFEVSVETPSQLFDHNDKGYADLISRNASKIANHRRMFGCVIPQNVRIEQVSHFIGSCWRGRRGVGDRMLIAKPLDLIEYFQRARILGKNAIKFVSLRQRNRLQIGQFLRRWIVIP